MKSDRPLSFGPLGQRVRASVLSLTVALLLSLPASAIAVTRATSQALSPATSFSCSSVTEIPQTECQALVTLYEDTDGPHWSSKSGWLTSTTPSGWEGVRVAEGYVVELHLSENRLSGTVPPELAKLTGLRLLYLSGNDLVGSIPPELGSLARLEQLALGDYLVGSIPPELGNLTNLQRLDLGPNRLSGNIPSKLRRLASLQTLELDDNRLTGSIPPELGNLTNLETLSLRSNELSGSIPPELGNLLYLENLYLSRNQLSGSIPPELGSLARLGSLSLAENPLSGSLPTSLLHLHRLSAFSFRLTSLCEPGNAAFQSWLSRFGTYSRTNARCPELAEVAIDGASAGASNFNYVFTAAAGPISVTLPITFTWQTTDQTPVTQGDVYTVTSRLALSWPVTGTKTITVTAANPDGAITATHTFVADRVPVCFELPLVWR